jgi:hypothetical protein
MNTITNLEFSSLLSQGLMNGGGKYNAGGRANEGKADNPIYVRLLAILSTFNAVFKDRFAGAFIQ